MEAARQQTPYDEAARKEACEKAEKKQGDYFEDLASYIIVNDPEKAAQAPPSQTQAEHSRVESPTPEVTPPEENENDGKPVQQAAEGAAGEEGDDDDKYKWKPGFCLQLGSQGRKAMLHLLRNAYKANKKFKNVFEKMDPPTTISDLPFFKISMLWQLAHELEVFDQAVAIHNIYGKVRHRSHKVNNQPGGQFYAALGAPRIGFIRSPKLRRVQGLYAPEYYLAAPGDERHYYMAQRNNMHHLKRNVDHIMAIKKLNPEQFVKFMGNVKERKCVVELVEARVRRGQAVAGEGAVDGDELRAAHTHEVLETADGHAARAGDKLQKGSEGVLVEPLQKLPEPHNLIAGLGVVDVLHVLAQVGEVNGGDAADEQLELLVVENGNQLRGNQLLEAGHEGLQLVLDAVGDLVATEELDVLVLVLVGDGDVAAVGDQVDDLYHAELVDLGREEKLQPEVLEPAVVDGGEVLVELGVDGLRVGGRDLAAQHVLVEGAREVGVDVLAVVNGLADHAADELEVVEVLGVDAAQRVGVVELLLAALAAEEAVVGVEHFSGEDVEPLAGQAAGVDALLAGEGDRELALQLVAPERVELAERVREDAVAADVDADRVETEALPTLLQLLAEVVPLDVEVQAVGREAHNGHEAGGQQRGGLLYQTVERLRVALGEVDEAQVVGRDVDAGLVVLPRLFLGGDAPLTGDGDEVEVAFGELVVEADEGHQLPNLSGVLRSVVDGDPDLSNDHEHLDERHQRAQLLDNGGVLCEVVDAVGRRSACGSVGLGDGRWSRTLGDVYQRSVENTPETVEIQLAVKLVDLAQLFRCQQGSGILARVLDAGEHVVDNQHDAHQSADCAFDLRSEGASVRQTRIAADLGCLAVRSAC
ncbi:uncharacterized protein BcabD6B2_55920 [Babesia caballi]|uniref:Uncharacterized protein n=1 Tax=Babesia caballi TaxID=5871 RepID=A0AAV4M249_BABCB|nr:hypothetical protein, conserved [Babesia caballi]